MEKKIPQMFFAARRRRPLRNDVPEIIIFTFFIFYFPKLLKTVGVQ